MTTPNPLPDDTDTLKAALIETRAKLVGAQALIEHLQLVIAKMKRDMFGPRSERSQRLIDQMELQLEELVAAAKASPGKLNIGTINPGSTQNLAAELFVSTAGIKAAIVPFRTSPDMAGAVMRGDVDVAFEFYAALSGLLADTKIVALASTGAKRTAYLPDVPTVMESGITDYDVASWNGLSVPAGTPKPVIATLNAAMKDVIPGPDVQSKASQMGMAMRWSTPEDMTARMKADIAKWGAVIEKAGIAKRE